jgi:hypothetical protein
MSRIVLVEHFPIGLHFLFRLRTVVESVTWGKPAGFPHLKVPCCVLRHSKVHRAGVITQSLQLQAQITSASLGWCHKSVSINLSLQPERWRCQYWSAYAADTIMWLGYEGGKVWETRAEGCHAEWRGHCGRNSALYTSIQVLLK